MPHAASREEQIRVAENVLRTRGSALGRAVAAGADQPDTSDNGAGRMSGAIVVRHDVPALAFTSFAYAT
jgi:hypothetical protein